MKRLRVLAGLLNLGLVSVAQAGVALAPTSISSPQGDFGGGNALENIINQSGLSATYISGVTDFGSFTATTTHSFPGNSGFTATESSGPQQFSFDLGALTTIIGIAIWNTNSVGAVTSFELYSDTDFDFNNGTSELLISDTPLLTGLEPAPAQVFSFDAITTRYIHINGTGSLAPPDFYGLGEVVFEVVEPQGPVPALDIKPGSCPNSFNRNSNGVLPVGLLGTDEFDVADVDLSTVVISRADGVGGTASPNEGPPGPHSVFQDVGTPFDGELCDCHEMEGDGIDDLSMKFRSQELVEALELNDLPHGALVELCVSGTLLDGAEFQACDCIRLVPPGMGALQTISAAGNYGLEPGSPPIDAEDNSAIPIELSTDPDSNPLIDDPNTVDSGRGTPPIVDMGAYELQAACDGDTNDDGVVNVDDLTNVILDWGTDGSANGGDLTGPIAGSPPDGTVGVNDLNAVIVGWGACP